MGTSLENIKTRCTSNTEKILSLIYPKKMDFSSEMKSAVIVSKTVCDANLGLLKPTSSSRTTLLYSNMCIK